MRKFLLIVSVFIALACIGLAGITVAAEVKSGDTPTVAAGTEVNDDLFIAGEIVSIEGTVNGDVYAAGKQIKVTGTITGDLLAVGQTIDVSGTVDQDIRVAGQTINISNARVGDSVTIAADTATLDRTSTVTGGILFAGNTLVVNAPVGRGITAAGSTVTIDNSVKNHIQAQVGKLVLENQANIGGNISYKSDSELTRQEGSRVIGSINRQVPSDANVNRFASFMRKILIWSYLSALVAGLALLLLMRRVVRAVSDTIATRFWPSMGWGTLAFLIMIPLTVVLLITVIGIPLALLTVTGFVVLLYLSKIFVGLALGRWLFKTVTKDETPNAYASFVIGLSVLYLLKVVPFVNGLVALATVLLGVGAVLITLQKQLFPTSNAKAKPKPKAK